MKMERLKKKRQESSWGPRCPFPPDLHTLVWLGRDCVHPKEELLTAGGQHNAVIVTVSRYFLNNWVYLLWITDTNNETKMGYLYYRSFKGVVHQKQQLCLRVAPNSRCAIKAFKIPDGKFLKRHNCSSARSTVLHQITQKNIKFMNVLLIFVWPPCLATASSLFCRCSKNVRPIRAPSTLLRRAPELSPCAEHLVFTAVLPPHSCATLPPTHHFNVTLSGWCEFIKAFITL